MKYWLATRGVFLKATTLYIVIPAHYSWSSAVQHTNREAKAGLKQSFKKF